MTKARKKGLVKTDFKKKTKNGDVSNKTDVEVLRYIELVEQVRKSRSSRKVNDAFDEIVTLLNTKLRQISYRFKIPGHSNDDVYQEALFALRYKAIKDYDPSRSDRQDISPFDKFAILCIRRHLSTKLKASYQNKQKVWITSISLDQDRSTGSSDDSLAIIDIVTYSEESVLDDLDVKEYKKSIVQKLYSKLSEFEKHVFLLYCQRHSYSEISKRINAQIEDKSEKVNVKSIDNALSRIKLKAREIVEKMKDQD